MDNKLPGGRFRVFLAVLGVCVAAAVVLSYFELPTAAGKRGESGTLEKMIVANGTVTMNVDLARLNGARGASRPTTLQFGVNEALFTILVFNNELRGALPSAMDITAQTNAVLPARLNASYRQLSVESVPRGSEYELVVRDSKTGFTFFGVEGASFNYDPAGRSMTIQEGRLVLAEEFAAALGRPAEARSVVGDLAINATMRPIEVQQIVDNDVQSDVMPAGDNGTNPGPDVVVGNLIDIQQFGSAANNQVGVAIGTESCNYGTIDLDWFALPNNDHPVIPQNLYKMSGGATNDERFEQIGQSWMKHAFTALTNNICSLGCNGVGGSHLGSGCSDPYTASLNGGQTGIGSRAWVNPFTGFYPSGNGVNNHSGHSHLGPSHRILTNVDDLNTTLNPNASYYGEAQYVTPHEYQWCTSHPGTCFANTGNNTYNNASYRKVTVSGTGSPFGFTWSGQTVRFQPAVYAWNGATVLRVEPDPGNDGVVYIAYKVTNPSAGVYHYEYAIYNQNLDRGVQGFTLPVGSGVTKSNLGFHAPPQHPGWTGDGTLNDQGYSSTPWGLTETPYASQWASATYGVDQNANACRWATMYNIRFDSDREPSTMFATLTFFKTGAPVSVQVQGPSSGQAPWPCTSRRRNGIPIPSCG